MNNEKWLYMQGEWDEYFYLGSLSVAMDLPGENKANLLFTYTLKRRKEIFRNLNFP